MIAAAGPAIVGFLASCLGGLIGGGTSVWLARQKRQAEFRAARRLVEDELYRAVTVLTEWREEGTSRPPAWRRQPLDTGAWTDGRSVLGHSLERREWLTVRDGYRALDGLVRTLEAGRGVEPAELRAASAEISEAWRILSNDSGLPARLRARALRRTRGLRPARGEHRHDESPKRHGAPVGRLVETAVDPDLFERDDSAWPGWWTQEDLPDLAGGDLETRLTAALESLPPLRRRVLVLRDVEGWPAKRVCDELLISERHQAAMLHRARAAVRRALVDDTTPMASTG